MINFLKGEAYYLKKDSMFRGICFMFLFASILLLVWIGTQVGFDISSPAQPLTMATPLSLFLYFIIPIHACFFATEGFEYGSVKNIIASGQSRSSYIIGKYLTEIKVIIWWVFQFFGIFYALYMAATLTTGSHIGNNNLSGDLITVFSALGFNILYLAAYSAIVMMVGMLVRKTASAVVITFLIIFGDFMLFGYLKDSSYAFLRMVSDNTLMTQIMKFSGMYVANSQHILLAGINDYIRVTLIPIIIVAICLIVTLVSFEKRDIHT
ncbi:ABC transporter permease [Paenibacillus sp. IHBB 10380]|uniref:ABC transporter permease n=1 Tax=Paenibacillus sp. IHBB 10380 TaxID=1566358 RepID=UPI0005CF94A4|nr:ABC transporter permease [Paenibacillus sp. IHBB 10380]AJS60443.1 hypothetical protein UB51_20530 [Paenibacillus sp. IHBB 10380]